MPCKLRAQVTHAFTYELLAQATPFLVGLDLLISIKPYNSALVNHHLLVNATLFGSDTPPYKFKQHTLVPNNTFLTSKQHFPHFTTPFRNLSNSFFFNSIQTTLFFYLIAILVHLLCVFFLGFGPSVLKTTILVPFLSFVLDFWSLLGTKVQPKNIKEGPKPWFLKYDDQNPKRHKIG